MGTCTGQTDTGRWLERYLCALFARWFTCVVLLDLRRLFIARDPASSCGTQRRLIRDAGRGASRWGRTQNGPCWRCQPPRDIPDVSTAANPPGDTAKRDLAPSQAPALLLSWERVRLCETLNGAQGVPGAHFCCKNAHRNPHSARSCLLS